MKREIRGAAVEKRKAYALSLRAPQEGEAFRSHHAPAIHIHNIGYTETTVKLLWFQTVEKVVLPQAEMTKM